MPRLSDTMEDGVVVTWLKQVGDKVVRGEILAEIETDKALMELEAYDDGVLERILAEPGSRVPIGTPIALVGDGSRIGDTAPVAGAGAAPDGSAVPETVVDSEPVVAQQVLARDGRPKSSPLARKIAAELGVDLLQVPGSGPGGRIIRSDVESAHGAGAAAAQAAAIPAQVAETATRPVAAGDYIEEPLSTLQRVAAKRLTESKQQAPHFYLTSAIDVTDLLGFRAEINKTLEAAGKHKVSVNDLIVKAVAAALRAEPAVNVSFAGDKLLRHNGVHLGVAVAVPAGLVVPVIRDADRKGVSEIAVETVEKAERARAGRLKADEMTGGTFTISNLGMFGIEQFAAVINPPEAAILAVGAATDELRLADGEVVARKILRVTLSADHRAVDGATGARFLQQLRGIMEHPLRIVT
ncbi:2-oxo acid dehydrogenase subunit E2 [Nocardia panacis]|uniref:Dihydrolipoamide acetyltransferase component of pyruvate dehydrogenase complex n=2 Tax=Nocardia panacis TaxID=2340916 RepID=A0A3A4K229_9NOCA|nr:2-oxo acid dehydrogenase subunit E2 [Nocardia panacis]